MIQDDLRVEAAEGVLGDKYRGEIQKTALALGKPLHSYHPSSVSSMRGAHIINNVAPSPLKVMVMV